MVQVLRDCDDFVLGADGSKIASTKFQSFTIRSGTECYIFQLVAIPDEKSETVREAFQSYLSSFPDETQQHFASKCMATASDSAANALKSCKLIMETLDKITPRERLHLKCSMHKVCHMEKCIRACIQNVFDDILQFCEAYLTCSRSHGLHGSQGSKLKIYLEALRSRDGLQKVTKPLEMQSHVRFGNLTRNLQRIATNYSDIVDFIRFELALTDDAKVMEDNKAQAIIEFASSAMVYSVIVSPYWSKVSGLMNSEQYLSLEEHFKQVLKDVLSSSSPALFLLKRAKEIDSSSWELGFEDVVLEISRDTSNSKFLDECIKMRLHAVEKRFGDFVNECSFPFAKEISFTNQDCERSFGSAKDSFSSKYNMDTFKFQQAVMSRFNMTFSFWRRQTDFEQKLGQFMANASSKEASITERRRSDHNDSIARMLSDIEEGEKNRTQVAVFEAVIAEHKLWPSPINEADDKQCLKTFTQLVQPNYPVKVSLHQFRGHVLGYINKQLSAEDKEIIQSKLKKKRSLKELFNQTVEHFNKLQ
ncbi:Oidioi.mRNA.OKI2018_I69.chr2.g3968.t1.cds [Oikopleura dioica]|uniref:Oidioi.mRNA.OKI2018_I69.chr2.g3968.t1.cds n=1 Tax=Oikopleura dioica TaxID=34765 RepID=A0ABN7SWC9_OIKDI|nr:Oidioi.mRNA.OKI2018_I69.chr2.g3968.t1.cds [Oikopleura dioica]